MYILEAHPDNEYFGLHLAGSKREVKRLNHALLLGTLGAMAAKTAEVDLDPLLYHTLRGRSRDPAIRNIPRRLTLAVGSVLGDGDKEYANLGSRLDVLGNKTVAGHLTAEQLLKETNILYDLINREPPQWLTHDGLFASFSDGRIVVDVKDIEEGVDPNLEEYGSRIAREVGVDTYTYQVAVADNTPSLTASPSILSRDHVALGRMTPQGVFDPIVTTLNMSEYRQNYPDEQSS
jgi:hypothetical protein